MSEQEKPKHGALHHFFQHVEISAVLTLMGIILLFSGAVVVTLIAPRYVDPTWTSPTSPYQVQMYEMADHNLYISQATSGGSTLQFVYHIQKGRYAFGIP